MKQKFLKKQKGMSLLEVIVSMLICGIGLAGMIAAIQASQRLASSAEYRAVATREIQAAVDMMRANRLGANEYVRVGSSSSSKPTIEAAQKLCADRTREKTTARDYCNTEINVAESVAKAEASKWQERIAAELPNGFGQITATDKGGIYVFTVKITWTVGNENRNNSSNVATAAPAGGSTTQTDYDVVADSLQMSFSL